MTFSVHLNRKCPTAAGLRDWLQGGSHAEVDASFNPVSSRVPVDVEDSMSTSLADTFFETSFWSPAGFGVTFLPVSSAQAQLFWSFSSCAFCVETDSFWDPGAVVGAAVTMVTWELGPADWGALGSSRSCRAPSRRFWRMWIHVFSTAVRRRLCSCLLQGTRLCSTCRDTHNNPTDDDVAWIVWIHSTMLFPLNSKALKHLWMVTSKAWIQGVNILLYTYFNYIPHLYPCEFKMHLLFKMGPFPWFTKMFCCVSCDMVPVVKENWPLFTFTWIQTTSKDITAIASQWVLAAHL